MKLLYLVDLLTIFELNTSDDRPRLFKSPQSAPPFLSALPKFVHHCENRMSGNTPSGFSCPQAHGGKGGLNGVACSYVLPMCGWIIVKSQKLFLVLFRAFRRLWVLI
jgi:hypothetical protein